MLGEARRGFPSSACWRGFWLRRGRHHRRSSRRSRSDRRAQARPVSRRQSGQRPFRGRRRWVNAATSTMCIAAKASTPHAPSTTSAKPFNGVGRGNRQGAGAPQPQQAGAVSPTPFEKTVKVFHAHLALKDNDAIYVTLGTVAANLLAGPDPVWLGLIGSPSTAKTELLNAWTPLSYVHVPRDVHASRIALGDAEETKGERRDWRRAARDQCFRNYVVCSQRLACRRAGSSLAQVSGARRRSSRFQWSMRGGSPLPTPRIG